MMVRLRAPARHHTLVLAPLTCCKVSAPEGQDLRLLPSVGALTVWTACGRVNATIRMAERVSRGTRFLALCWAAVSLLSAAQVLAEPREIVGPARCVRCHTDEMAWWTTSDGPPPNGHVNALLQLESPAAKRYLQRLGMRGAYEPGGSCVTCHATSFKGDAREGVSCESCHGPGGGYLEVHAQPGAYRLAVSAGMADLIGRVNAWVARCLECHFVKDERLVAAGHSSGRAFDLGAAFTSVARHWKRTYDASVVAAAGRALTGRGTGPARVPPPADNR